ncbi:uncharacterized protein LOC128734804 [Sabethes cyaneus]|uniref:uncharacterized protein LOC128734804 n=1 Tax=Sabethes cyaneus TaxID=53552 RepID=UPI00237D3EFB|nr:uncharacterized protein LOC128734804 [Sabethes cyaneus]
MDIFQNQCTESLGFDSMLASNTINSPLPGTDSPTHLTFSTSPFFTSIPPANSIVYTGGCSSAATNSNSLTLSSGVPSGPSGPNDVVLPSIFVKVPKQINQQYQQQSQSNNSSDDIKCEDKSEPIKRELGDLRALEKGTAMVQLPGTAEQYLADDRRQEAREESQLVVYCCEFCPFVTIEDRNLREHTHAKHANRQRSNLEVMVCPACENKFYKLSSLEHHLLDDHMMCPAEMRALVNRRFPPSESQEPTTSITTQHNNTIPVSVSSLTTAPEQNKSRIYIKNVQLLKKPDVIEQENVQHAQEQQAEQQQEQQQGRNIFIRNVSLLQNANYAQNVDNVFQNPSGLHESKYSFIVPVPSPNSQSPPVGIGDAGNANPPRSKIFIRNVDILRNPLLSITPPSISSTCEMSRTSSSESLYTTPPPQVVSPATSINSVGTASMGGCSGLNMVLIPTSTCSSNSSTPPMIATPPAITVATSESMLQSLPQPRKSKIFIKNISVLKQPTIHLKSVDELNLMTIDQLQLQNLLPPNTSNNCTQSMESVNLEKDDHGAEHQLEEDDFGNVLDEPPPSEEMDGYAETENQYHEIQNCNSICGSLPTEQESYQPEFNNDFIIIEPGNSADNVPYAGQADHLRLPTQANDLIDHQQLPPPPAEPPDSQQYHQTDEDILFVCAEEIINLDPPVQAKTSPEPPLQPVTPLAAAPLPQQGRIYVSDNLMEHHSPLVIPPPPPQQPQPSQCLPGSLSNPITPLNQLEQINIDAASTSHQHETQLSHVSSSDLPSRERTRSRGRPKGAKQTGITKLKKLYTNLTPLEEGYKCDLLDCGARFRQPETLAYHKRCHVPPNERTSPEGIRCPECGSQELRNWNTLHTHLWREHNIDMELYCCNVCNFKTPVLCRLNNTHMKIHSDEKNFICAICDKGFKNNKQLRNHRRYHRELGQPTKERHPAERKQESNTYQSLQPVNCVKCGLKFSNQKILKAHVESKHSVAGMEAGGGKSGRLKCSICGMLFKTRYLLISHVAKHSDEKKFKCQNCDYSTNDHNAIRRHKMRHNSEAHMYRCSYCDYTSIQSTTYRKHLERMHADVASNLLYKCSQCAFVSISELKYQLHRAKHESNEDINELDHGSPANEIAKLVAEQPLDDQEEQERHCESVNSDVVIVERDQPEPPLDAFSLIPPLQSSGTELQEHPAYPLQPIIRPAGFANNLSKVDNFYGYTIPALDTASHHYQQQAGTVPDSAQQDLQLIQVDVNASSPSSSSSSISSSTSTVSSAGAATGNVLHQNEYLNSPMMHGIVPLGYGENTLGS